MQIAVDMNEIEGWVQENLYFCTNANSVVMSMVESMSDEELLNLAAEMGYFNGVL